MKFFSYLSIALLLCFAVAVNAQSNKFGHINSAELLQMMPEIKAADSTLAAYQKQLEDQNQAMLNEYQGKVTDYQKNETTMPDAVKDVKQQEIQDLQQRIQTFQQTAQDKFQQKKEELYSPILKKAEDAIIAAVAEAKQSDANDLDAAIRAAETSVRGKPEVAWDMLRLLEIGAAPLGYDRQRIAHPGELEGHQPDSIAPPGAEPVLQCRAAGPAGRGTGTPWPSRGSGRPGRTRSPSGR
jgi:outer membrane protein